MKDVDNSNSINSFLEHVFEFAHMSEDSKEEYQLAYPLIFNHRRFDYLIKIFILKIFRIRLALSTIYKSYQIF